MLPGTFVYVNAGTQLAQIESAADTVARLAVVLCHAWCFPLLAKTG